MKKLKKLQNQQNFENRKNSSDVSAKGDQIVFDYKATVDGKNLKEIQVKMFKLN